MKFKYRKIVLAVSVTAMSLGVITLSIQAPAKELSAEVDGNAADDPKTASGGSIGTVEPDAGIVPTPGAIGAADGGQGGEGQAGPSKQETKLEKNAVSEINGLIRAYLDAKLECDLEALALVVNDTGYFDMADMQKRTEKIEKYSVVDCYTIAGPEEGAYVVYVYEKIKISGIKTLASSLDKLYVRTDDKGKKFIYYGEIDDAVMTEIEEFDTEKEVSDLIKAVNDELTDALKSDKDLADYYEKLNAVAGTGDKGDAASGDDKAEGADKSDKKDKEDKDE